MELFAGSKYLGSVCFPSTRSEKTRVTPNAKLPSLACVPARRQPVRMPPKCVQKARASKQSLLRVLARQSFLWPYSCCGCPWHPKVERSAEGAVPSIKKPLLFLVMALCLWEPVLPRHALTGKGFHRDWRPALLHLIRVLLENGKVIPRKAVLPARCY